MPWGAAIGIESDKEKCRKEKWTPGENGWARSNRGDGKRTWVCGGAQLGLSGNDIELDEGDGEGLVSDVALTLEIVGVDFYIGGCGVYGER